MVGETCREYVERSEGLPVPAGAGAYSRGPAQPVVSELPIEVADPGLDDYLTTRSGNTCYYRPHNWWSYKYDGWDSAAFEPSPTGQFNQYVKAANNRSSVFGGTETSTYTSQLGMIVGIPSGIARVRVTIPWSFRGAMSAENSVNTLGAASAEVQATFSVGLERNGFENKQEVATRSVKADGYVPGERAIEVSGAGTKVLETSVSAGDQIKAAQYFDAATTLYTVPLTNARAAFNVHDTQRNYGYLGGATQRWDITMQPNYYLTSCGG